jgi:integrase
MKAKITKRLVDSLKPAAKLYEVCDTELAGFRVRVAPTGRMSFYLDYRNEAGQRLKYKVGSYPGIAPEGARRLASEASGKVAGRIDPQAEKKAAKVEGERARVSTLGAFIDGKYAEHARVHLRRGDVAVARLKADFAKWLDVPLMWFNPHRMESWRRERLKAGLNPVTINRQIDTLKAALQHALKEKIIETHPLQGFKRLKAVDDKRLRYLSPNEENRLRSALLTRESNMRAARARGNEWRRAREKKLKPTHAAEFVDHIRPLVLIALNTGLRRGELFSLRWSDLERPGWLVVRAAAAKSGKRRDVPLNPEAARVLHDWRQQSKKTGDVNLVFPGDDDARMTNIVKGWGTVCKLADLKDFRFHDCRHHFASKMVQRGIDLNVVRELLGHADIKMTLRYSHLSPDNLTAAVAKLA